MPLRSRPPSVGGGSFLRLGGPLAALPESLPACIAAIRSLIVSLPVTCRSGKAKEV